jgi:GrpB-like predicted nucleotidyltransferase (UPF0157 family)
VNFLEPQSYQPLAQQIFGQLSTKIQRMLPEARIEHIGSSLIEEALSKGDLDIFVGVEPEALPAAIAAIESLGFRVKNGSFRNQSLCPFESDAYPLDVGLQLVANGSEFEYFLTFRDHLNADLELRSAYNVLKRDACELGEDEYRKLKSNFIERVLGGSLGRALPVELPTRKAAPLPALGENKRPRFARSTWV